MSTIVALAKTLNLTVTGEGVETEEQLLHLRTLGCEQGQGYSFGRPLPAAAASEILKRTGSLLPELEGSVPAV